MKLLLAAGAFFLSLLTLHAEPVPLFDGRTLDGWDGDPKLWRVEEGMIAGGSLTEKVTHNDFLATKKSYANFDLRVKLKLSGTGFVNSGVQIRSLRIKGSPEMFGYQVDYGAGWYGKLYDESRRNKVIALSVDQKAAEAAIKEGDWNEYRIRTEGPRIRSWINGVPALDFTETDPNIAQDGLIGIQIHGGGMALVQVKEVTIEELPPTPDAPTWEKLGGVEGVKAKLTPPKPAADAAKPARDISYNAVGSLAKTPAEELATFTVPAGYKVELVASEDVANGIGKFVPIAFDQQGRLWTTTALEYPVDGNENPAAADALYASKARDKVLIYDRDPSSPTGYTSKPRVFAEGLAIPLGVLPYKDGCYVLHGHDIVFMEDTDGDGKADKTTVILTGFGVQDSHLFPHQFTRAPGGWIWMAQGAFNYGKVSRPGDEEHAVQFDQTRMAKFRPDGSGFDITSNGPCNIWGLVINGEGEAFIQEANDFGYPVMPFHEYANYPGCSNRQWKSYAPEFPGTAPDFRVGGTGLSGLALTDSAGLFTAPWADVMLLANPITNKLNAIKMHRDGPRWKLEQLPDFMSSSDPWFRPVAITIGPDGCLYIVDWYNKIISHNEVPRNHPDRDKTRGRIWRVSPVVGKPFDVPDFTKLSGDELLAKLGGASLTQSHLAWQAIGDRGMTELAPKLKEILTDGTSSKARRIQSLWAIDGINPSSLSVWPFGRTNDADFLREMFRKLSPSAQNGDAKLAVSFGNPSLEFSQPEVEAERLRCIGKWLDYLCAKPELEDKELVQIAIFNLVSGSLDPLDGPVAPSTQNHKPIKVDGAYDRDFERYLVRMFLERHPAEVAASFDLPTHSEKGSDGNVTINGRKIIIPTEVDGVLMTYSLRELPIENQLLAALSITANESAKRVAALLPLLKRSPGQEELLRLSQFPEEPGVGGALKSVLSNPTTSAGSLEALLVVKTRLDAAKLAPLLTEIARGLLGSGDATKLDLGIRLTGAFQLGGAEPALAGAVQAGLVESRDTVKGEPGHRTHLTLTPAAALALKALADMRADQLDLFDRVARFGDDLQVRDEALRGLASARSAAAGEAVLKLWPNLDGKQRYRVLGLLVSTKPGAGAVVAALTAGKIAKEEVDGDILDKMQAVLGAEDPTLRKLVDSLGVLFRPVLALDGSEAAWTQTSVTLEGPCTIEGWLRLDAKDRKIGNVDGLAGAPGQLDLNFFGERPRVYAFPPLGDVAVAKKPFTPGLWTHLAATRDVAGIWKLYIDGEFDNAGTKAAPGKIENVRLAWTSAKDGTLGALSEVRIWNVERTVDEIRAAADRSLPAGTPGLLFTSASGDWGQLQAGAKIVKTTDYPPVFVGDEAAALDAKYAKFRVLANQPGDIARGKQAAALCQACHLMGPIGGNIGPNLSGVGAMGTEGILRNVLQPNAAMENGYRIYRVELVNGDLVDALYVSEDKDAVVIRQPGAADRRIPKKEIRDAKYLRRSLMPEGLLETFTPEQVSDLFAYLRTLK